MWDQRYNSDTYVYGEAPNNFLAQQAHLIPEGPVLCLAEGEGRNAVYLASQGYEVHAVDQSVVGREKALQLASKSGTRIQYGIGDLAHLEAGQDQWSGIVSIFAHTPSALRRELHAKVVAGLKPGGVLILEAFSPDQLSSPGLGGPRDLDMLMALTDLKQEFEALHLQIAREVVRTVDEGELHQGECNVVQLVGVKRSP